MTFWGVALFMSAVTDCTTLSALWTQFDTPFPLNSTNCCSSAAPVQITCTGNSITRLGLENAQAKGTIPSDLVRLQSLTYLNLKGNALKGLIPSSLGRLPITSLYLSGNKLEGPIPDELESSAQQLSSGAIIGIGVGSALFVVVLGIGAYIGFRHLQRKKQEKNGTPSIVQLNQMPADTQQTMPQYQDHGHLQTGPTTNDRQNYGSYRDARPISQQFYAAEQGFMPSYRDSFQPGQFMNRAPSNLPNRDVGVNRIQSPLARSTVSHSPSTNMNSHVSPQMPSPESPK
ncbi:hypothetical protein EDD86DRAFT_253551 [Gorgonomyces haynaldii]|nr:hypothetical protein EDD86DRAFT_253551 [Gorgonomyces haynaldii]